MKASILFQTSLHPQKAQIQNILVMFGKLNKKMHSWQNAPDTRAP